MAAQAYVPYAWSPNNTLIQNKSISANEGRFFINKGTTDGNRWWIDITGTGGQTLFLGKYGPYLSYAKWALGSTVIDGKDVDGGFLPSYGTGALTFVLGETEDGQPKLVNTGNYGGSLGTPSTNEWSACAVDEFFSVEAGRRIESGLKCYDFELVLKETDAPAPQYYHYWDEL